MTLFSGRAVHAYKSHNIFVDVCMCFKIYIQTLNDVIINLPIYIKAEPWSAMQCHKRAYWKKGRQTEDKRRTEGRTRHGSRMKVYVCRTEKKWGRWEVIGSIIMLLSPVITDTVEGQCRCFPTAILRSHLTVCVHFSPEFGLYLHICGIVYCWYSQKIVSSDIC